MTILADTSTSSRSAARLAAGLLVIRNVAAFLKAISWPLRYWVDQRRTMNLLDLDDRMLSDLGVSRSDVAGALYAGHALPSTSLAERAKERRQAAIASRQEAQVAACHLNITKAD